MPVRCTFSMLWHLKTTNQVIPLLNLCRGFSPLPVKGCLLTLTSSFGLGEDIYPHPYVCTPVIGMVSPSPIPEIPAPLCAPPQGQGLPSHQDRKLQLYSGQSLAFPKVQLLLLFTKNMCTPFPQLPNLWLARFFLLVGTQ